MGVPLPSALSPAELVKAPIRRQSSAVGKMFELGRLISVQETMPRKGRLRGFRVCGPSRLTKGINIFFATTSHGRDLDAPNGLSS
jgi:hypothetical protein